ncbi:MAG: hypothetical protein AABX77_02275 [Nanoarchaeota archaeon]
MKDKRNFSLKEKISFYFIIGGLSLLYAFYTDNNYQRDLARYDAKLIHKKPDFHDYILIGKLENLVFSNKDGCFFLKKLDLEK